MLILALALLIFPAAAEEDPILIQNNGEISLNPQLAASLLLAEIPGASIVTGDPGHVRLVSVAKIPNQVLEELNPANLPPSDNAGGATLWTPFGNTGHRDVVVALLDTGVDYEHPALKDYMWINKREVPNDKLDNDSNGYVDDYHGWNPFVWTPNVRDFNGHGTHCAGIIEKVVQDYRESAGIKGNVTIMPIAIMDRYAIAPYNVLYQGINYAIRNHADIICITYGRTPGEADSDDLTLIKEIIEYAGEQGILCICDAGSYANDNDVNKVYPASLTLENILSVTATDDYNNLTSFSDWGQTSVDVAAQGTNINSTVPVINKTTITITNYSTMSILGDSWFMNGTDENVSATIRGENASLIYYQNPVSTQGDCFHFQLIFEGNLTNPYPGQACNVYIVFSKTNISTFSNLSEFIADDNVTFGGFLTDINSMGMKLDLQTSLNWDLFSFNGEPVYFGLFYQSGTPTDYFTLYKTVFTTNFTIDDHQYAYMNGTSMATAWAAGGAAVLKLRNPALSPAEIKQLLISTSDTGNPTLNGKTVSNGSINLTAAIQQVPFQITVNRLLKGGNVSANPAGSVVNGTTVTLTYTISPGYGLKSYDIYNTFNPSEKVANSSSQFVMPAFDVTVSGVFAPLNITNETTHTDTETVATFDEPGTIVKKVAIQNATSAVTNVSLIYKENAPKPGSDESYVRTALTMVFDITLTGDLGSDNTTITFNLTSNELQGHGPETVYLAHQKKNGVWEYFKPTYVLSGDTYTFTVTGVTSFSLFVPVSMVEIPKQTPDSSSSRPSGATRILQETAEPTPVATLTPVPTETPAASGGPSSGTASSQTTATPAPFIGIMAALGTAALFLRRR